MPSSGPAKKGLYLGLCIGDLNRLSEVKPLSSTVNNIIKSSDKVFKDAEKFDLQGDEERAFVMYMKYFNILKQVKTRNEYKKQKEFFDSLIGAKNQVKAIDRAEKLAGSLKDRYDLKEAEAVAKKLGAADSEGEKKSFQKDKTTNQNEKQDSKSEAQDIQAPTGTISCTHLCNLLRDSGTKLILMDVRPASDFLQSHLSHTDCISVPEDTLTPGSTVSHIESKLMDESKVVWKNRKHVDHIIIIDWKSKSEDIKVGKPVRTLRDALFKFDTSMIIKSEPLVLEGGYEQWLILYPTMTTNAHVSIPSGESKNKPPSPTFTLNFDYPDLDDNAKKIDKQPPPANSNDSISSQNGISSNSMPLVPKVDRSLKPSSSLSQITASASASANLNNAETSQKDNSQQGEGKQEGGNPGTDLYPRILPGIKHQNGPSDKKVNIVSDANPKSVNLTIRNNLSTELSQSIQQRKMEEASLKNFQVNRDGKLQENKERIEDTEKKLRDLELMKKKGEKDVADLMRMKRKITEELAMEKKKLDEDDRHLAAEEEKRLLALDKAKQDEEEKKRRLAEVEQLRVQRKLDEQNLALRKEEEAKREAEEAALLKQRELAESDRKELERLREAEAKRKQEEEEEAAKRKKAEEERKHQEELEVKAKKEEEERKAAALRERQEEKQREEEREKKLQKEKELQDLKREQEAQKAKASQSSPAKTASATQLPPGWEKRLNEESNRYYYIDHNRGTTQWEPPTATTPSSKKDGISVTKLRDEPGISSSRGLSRSHSSPNIMKQLADEEKARRAQQFIDRTSKPNKSAIAKQTAYSVRRRDLNPVFGNVGSALTGLRNLGNTCYMNSTVQCLSNTSPLVTYFLNENFLNDINRQNDKGMRGEVVDEFAVVIKALWSGEYRSITPRDLKSTIGKYNTMFAGYDQQDSQEFLTFLLDGLHEGLNAGEKAQDIPEQNNDNLSDERAAAIAWEHHRLLHRSFIVELFQGQLKSTLTCRTCRKTSTTFQPFMFLSLPIPKSSRCTLQNCIQEFLKPEMMTGSSRWKCTRCKVERDSEKKIDIWRLPPILLIGLNRFYSEGMWMQKKTTYVDFPVSDLDMAPWTEGSSKSSQYSLYGISNHYGTMEGGHYTAFCSNPVTRHWYKYDDQDVHEIRQSDIKSSAAFVLYYSSIPLKAPLYNPRL